MNTVAYEINPNSRITFSAPDEAQGGVVDATNIVLETSEQEQAWKKLASEIGIDESLLEFSENIIIIHGVWVFENTDTELVNGHWNIDLWAPSYNEAMDFQQFLYKEIWTDRVHGFLCNVMNMEWPAYWTSMGGVWYDSEKAWALTIDKQIVDFDLKYKEPSIKAQKRYPRCLRKMVRN